MVLLHWRHERNYIQLLKITVYEFIEFLKECRLLFFHLCIIRFIFSAYLPHRIQRMPIIIFIINFTICIQRFVAQNLPSFLDLTQMHSNTGRSIPMHRLVIPNLLKLLTNFIIYIPFQFIQVIRSNYTT